MPDQQNNDKVDQMKRFNTDLDQVQEKKNINLLNQSSFGDTSQFQLINNNIQDSFNNANLNNETMHTNKEDSLYLKKNSNFLQDQASSSD